jgi:hypothetical protein
MSALGQKQTSDCLPVGVRYSPKSGHRLSVTACPLSRRVAIFAAIRRALVAKKHDLDQRRGVVMMDDSVSKLLVSEERRGASTQ